MARRKVVGATPDDLEKKRGALAANRPLAVLEAPEPMIGAYVRVSSDGQSDRTPRAASRRAAAARGDDVRLWYAEPASGVRGRGASSSA